MWLEELSGQVESWARKICDLMSMGGSERNHAAHTHTHTLTHSEMSGILPSASLTVSMASMASMVAEGWAEREEEEEEKGKTGRERR